MRFVISTALLLSSSLAFAATTKTSAQPIIIDTDLFGDVDDVGALAIANILHNCGMAELKGIAINTHSKYGAPAASVRVLPPSTDIYSVQETKTIIKAVCSYFGNGNVPVAAIRPLTNETFFDDWGYVYVLHFREIRITLLIPP